MCSNDYDNISGDYGFIAAHKGNTCTIFDSSDGSIIVQIPDDGTLSSFDVVSCEVLGEKIAIYTTNGTDSKFVFYEDDEDQEWLSGDVIEGYVVNGEKYSSSNGDFLISATNENGEAFVYYYIDGGVSTE
jgi:hypothetical protein